ncbi:MAG: FAD-dependent oxidoreductase [Ottowia sp.]|nr:FAD-dependent oxidoreductase [Ottowia sp.]
MHRRQLFGLLTKTALAAALPLSSFAQVPARSAARVVVIGGGFAGATTAKYLRLFSAGTIQVVLVEPKAQFFSCPMSNRILSGQASLKDITIDYRGLKQYGVEIVQDYAQSIDITQRQVHLARGSNLSYDRLVVTPGIDFMWDAVPGMETETARLALPHAWQAGTQTQLLRQQLEAMPDGGVFAIYVPLAPYRCPPGPYERASLIADYFRQSKPKSKVLVLDANQDIVSKGALFKQAWAERYERIIEYRPSHQLMSVDAAQRTLKFEVHEDVHADVINIIPPMRAGNIAQQTGLATANGRWCEIDFLNFESKVAPHVHVLGDAIQSAPLMPKSAHIANQQGKVAAAAIFEMLMGHPPNPMPVYNNTCYSFVSFDTAIHIASVHRYAEQQRMMLPEAGGLSKRASALEGVYAQTWAQSIWADTLA